MEDEDVMKNGIEITWCWNVWMVGFFWTSHCFAIKIGPLHIAYWKRMKGD